MSGNIIGLAHLVTNLQRQNGEVSDALYITTFLTAISFGSVHTTAIKKNDRQKSDARKS